MRRIALPLLACAALFVTSALTGCETNEPQFVACREQADCPSGYACNQHPESQIGRCAEVCTEGCAPGFTCGGVEGTECVAATQ